MFANRCLHFLDGLETLIRIRLHGLHGDLHQLASRVVAIDFVLIDVTNLVARGRHQTLHRVLARVRRTARDDFKQHGSQQINVTGRPDLCDRPCGHFRRHVRRSATHAGALGNAVGFAVAPVRKCQAPVHHQNFVKRAQHDVFRLQVAVNDTAGVRECDGI